jgi:hypothetical protein
MAFNGPYDHTLNVSKKNVIDNDDPEYLQKLEKESGNSANEVKVELDEQERIANDDIMMNPQKLGDSDDVDETIKDMSYDKLLDIYQNGEKAGEEDEVTYDELVGKQEDPFSPDAHDGDFDLFPPEEQELYDQVQDDINKINEENPEETEEDFAPLDMDDLADIADGETDLDDDGSGQHVDMPNDSNPPQPPNNDTKKSQDMEPVPGFEF